MQCRGMLYVPGVICPFGIGADNFWLPVVPEVGMSPGKGGGPVSRGWLYHRRNFGGHCISSCHFRETVYHF